MKLTTSVPYRPFILLQWAVSVQKDVKPTMACLYDIGLVAPVLLEMGLN